MLASWFTLFVLSKADSYIYKSSHMNAHILGINGKNGVIGIYASTKHFHALDYIFASSGTRLKKEAFSLC